LFDRGFPSKASGEFKSLCLSVTRFLFSSRSARSSRTKNSCSSSAGGETLHPGGARFETGQAASKRMKYTYISPVTASGMASATASNNESAGRQGVKPGWIDPSRHDFESNTRAIWAWR
jgi:hypothetical protein